MGIRKTAFSMFVTEAVILGFFAVDVLFHCIGYGRFYLARVTACIDLALIIINIVVLVTCQFENLFATKLLLSAMLVFSRFEADMKELLDILILKRGVRV